MRLTLTGASGLVGDRGEYLQLEDGLLHLQTEAEVFGFGSTPFRKKVRRYGQRLYELFLDMVGVVQPWYGGLCIETPLQPPGELVRDRRSLGFQDFYLSAAHFGSPLVSRVVELFGPDAYVEVLCEGVYVSTAAYFNPSRKALDPVQAQHLSMKVAKLLGGAMASSGKCPPSN